MMVIIILEYTRCFCFSWASVFCLFLYCREVLGRVEVGVAEGPGGGGGKGHVFAPWRSAPSCVTSYKLHEVKNNSENCPNFAEDHGHVQPSWLLLLIVRACF